MPTWRVTLHGDSWTLDTVVGMDFRVDEEASAFVFRSSGVNGLSSAGAARRRAFELTEVLNGLARIAAREFEAVAVSDVILYDGGEMRPISIFVGDNVPVGDEVGVRIVDSVTGLPAPSASTVFGKGTAVAQRDPNVWRALRLFGLSTEPVNLFRVYEVIREDLGGQAEIVQRGWATNKQISRFTNSLDNRAAMGDKARHAVSKTQPPKKPMSLPEAQAFVTGLLEKWLASK
jgi:hypothetical protein